MKLRNLFICILTGLCLIGFSCAKDEESSKDTPMTPVQEQSEALIHDTKPIIAAYTSGSISREEKIRIRFMDDMVDSASINNPLKKSPFVFQPKIPGIAIWINSKTLEFRPEKRLPGGQKYNAKLMLSDLMEGSQPSETFDFMFSTIMQSFEINIDGLSATGGKDSKELQLSGKFITADSEHNMDVEKVLSAYQLDRNLTFEWEHSEDRRKHIFLIHGILREQAASAMVLEWNGKFINVAKKGKKIISISPAHTFAVSGARAVDADKQSIEIRFTDPLLKKQNLNGLITVNNKSDLKFTIDRNTILVYSQVQWAGNTNIKISPGVRESKGGRLEKETELTVYFENIKPQVRFVGKGVIIPTTQGLTIPIETVNLRAVTVEALEVFEKNIPQFLQVNSMDGTEELKRVGRPVWKKTISLDKAAGKRNQWLRYGLDVTPLIENHSGGLFRFRIRFKRQHIIYDCADASEAEDAGEEDTPFEQSDEEQESSYWDSYEQNQNWHEYYQNRENPCHPAFYRKISDHDISVYRNVLISDIGMIAKKGSNNEIFVAVSDIRTAEPMNNVKLMLLDFQQQIISEGRTDRNGVARLPSHSQSTQPFLVVAKNADQSGYLKLHDGSALAMSHFDVSGQLYEKGLKGFIYGERGVWRPGDPIYLTFILMDSDGTLPDNHPVNFELFNPRGLRVKSMVKKHSINGFYTFKTETAPESPTGNWTAKIKIGNVIFEKILKIETIMPNRLKIEMGFGTEVTSLKSGEIKCDLSSMWLHGAVAKELKADVELAFSPRKTKFKKYEEYEFDDPVRKYEPESQIIYDGNLDAQGKATITSRVETENVSPGMLMANFKTRVFEPSGAFSIDRFNIPFHPYKHYVGIRTPKGDKARGMLLTDTDHKVNLVMVDSSGDPVKTGSVEVEMYKIKWRWWWEKGRESIADYLGSSSYTPILKDTVEIKNSIGKWTFNIKYPSWGRYLIRAKNANGKHITGKILYVDWPGWAGRAQKDNMDGASILSFSSDKKEYQVGENVQITIPSGDQGRALITIESGRKILDAQWEKGKKEAVRFQFTTTKAMTPNVYVHVTYLQSHLQSLNDLPIRTYGVIPIKVIDPDSRLEPQLKVPDTFIPEETATLTVNEANGKPMTYTIAIVDEGLLGLTRFSTPNPWNYFYRKEALGIKTWDLFNQVAGAYGGTLEQLLAIGGDEEGGSEGQKKANRFPPVVQFLGPFDLKSNAHNTHEVEIPQYIGAVRVMLVAGNGNAFGNDKKTVFVKKPLMILGTLPRVLGPEEEVKLPISVFALEEKVKKVTMTVDVEGPIEIVGKKQKQLTFKSPGDKFINFKLKVKPVAGVASVTMKSAGGGETAVQKIDIPVRMPVNQVVEVINSTVKGKDTWNQDIIFPGSPGTNEVMLEVSRIPPLNLGKRLDYLIRYPHGCVEQVTSSVFPQLYLGKLIRLSPKKQKKIEHNVKAGILRLQKFQTSDGGFTYWPGNPEVNQWVTSYVGHFLVEAEKLGYFIPAGLIEQWKNYQKTKALSWVTGPTRSELIQAYRVYSLALSGAAELGAMNRLKEENDLPVAAKWRLAAAYQLAGQPEAARQLIKSLTTKIPFYRELSNTYGSDLRDKAMILESLSLMGELERAHKMVDEISERLANNKWMSTQTTAYALIAISQYVGLGKTDKNMSFEIFWNNEKKQEVSDSSPLIQTILPVQEETSGRLKLVNKGDMTLFPQVIVKGFPSIGMEKASENGLVLAVKYMDLDEKTIDPTALEQGNDFLVEVTVKNTGQRGGYEEIALTHKFPSGWEIHNKRIGRPDEDTDKNFDYQDIRDDRIYTYFDLKNFQTKTFRTVINTSYLGNFYLPMISAEAMYDSTIHARIQGRWIRVVKPGEFIKQNE